MRTLAASLLIGCASLVVGACQTIPGPGDNRIEAVQACGDDRAKYYCVPDTGYTFRLNRRAFSVPLMADHRPNVLHYLGTLRPVRDWSGVRGTPCGTSTTPFTNAQVLGFEESDVPLVFGRRLAQTRTVEFTVSADLKADLISALTAAGVPATVTDRLDASLNATVQRARKATFEVTGDFRQYQLDPGILNQLDFGEAPPGFEACMTELRSGQWSMYEAMTGWMVTKATMSSTTIDTITADLIARVALNAPEVDLATLSAALEVVVTDNITTADHPHFLIVGLSYWQPQRLVTD